MIKSTVSNKFIKTSVLLAFTALLGLSGKAANSQDTVTAKDLTVSTSYNNGLPTTTSDVIFPSGTATGTYTVSGAKALSIGTLDDLATSGTITVNSGTVTGANTITLNGGSNTVGGSTSDLLYVASGGTLAIANGTGGGTLGLVLNSSGNFDTVGTATISSVISGTGDIHKTGAGTLTLSGANTFTGNFYVDNTGSSGSLGANGAGSLGSGIVYLGVDGSSNGASVAVTVAGAGSLANSNIVVGTGTGIRRLLAGSGETLAYAAGNISFDYTSGTPTTLQLESGTSGALSELVLGNTLALANSSGSGAITGTGNLQILNSGANRASNVIFDDIVNNAGTITNGGGTNTSVVNVTFNNTIGSAVTSIAQNSTSDTGTFASVATLSAINSFNGPISIGTGATVTVTGAGSLGNNGTITGTTFTAGATNNDMGSIANSGTFTYASSATQTISGIISGNGAVNDTGTGPLILTGPNTYTGPTTVTGTVANPATLQVGNTTALGTSAVTATNAVVQGTVANVSLFSNVSLTNTVLQENTTGTGTFTLMGSSDSFALSGGTWDLDIAGAPSSGSFDMVDSGDISNLFTISNEVLNLVGSGLTAGTYDILNGFGAASTGSFSSINTNNSAYTATFQEVNGVGEVVVVAVSGAPEPTTWAMLLGGVALLVTIQSRRRASRV